MNIYKNIQNMSWTSNEKENYEEMIEDWNSICGKVDEKRKKGVERSRGNNAE